MKTTLITTLIVVLIIGGIFLYKNKQASHAEDKIQITIPAPTSDNDTDGTFANDLTEFTATFDKSYAEAKKELAAKGWTTTIPEGFQSAGDKTFPEIGDCGSGVDAICYVNFKKGDTEQHLDVQIGGQSGYTEWTVVGNE